MANPPDNGQTSRECRYWLQQPLVGGKLLVGGKKDVEEAHVLELADAALRADDDAIQSGCGDEVQDAGGDLPAQFCRKGVGLRLVLVC